MGRTDCLEARTDALEREAAARAHTVDNLKCLMSIEALRRSLRNASLETCPLVSVILPTCNRPPMLRRAIASVLAQRYKQWELLVVNDGHDEAARDLVQIAGDPRISYLESPISGACAARNHALEAAGGELIAYLDDDNMMDRDWLYAVVWAFERQPDVDLLYGAVAVDDYLRIQGDASGALPSIGLRRWSREALRKGNLAEMGAIAHRAGLPGTWFDESIEAIEDWDLLLRLTAEKDPLVFPAVACYYATVAPDRLTNEPNRDAHHAAVHARAAAGPRP